MTDVVKRAYDRTHRQRQAQLTRQAVIEAATRLFAERGYAATSMADLARAAGVAVQTIYTSFGSKVAVATAVIESTHPADIDRLIERMYAEADPARQLEMAATVARRLYDIGETTREAIRRAGNEVLFAQWRAREEKRYQAQAPLVGSLVKKRAVRPDLTPARAADVLWALTGRDLYELMVDRRGWSPDRFERWLADVLKRELLV